MKRITMLLVAIIYSFQFAHSQTANEWVNQNSTQKKYLIQQIAALQIYIGYLSKGYQIAKKGLNTIGSIKKGHLNLDMDFFASLETINPTILDSKLAMSVHVIYEQCLLQAERLKKKLGTERLISETEKRYLNDIANQGIRKSTNEMMRYNLFISPGLKMSDEERQRQIVDVYNTLLEIRTFLQSLNSEVRALVLQRKKTERDINTVSNLF